MATTNNLKKGLNRKIWELCGIPMVGQSVTGSFCAPANDIRQQVLFAFNATNYYLYLPEEDGTVQIPNPTLNNTFSAGITCAVSQVGPTGTATAGSATTLTTNQTILRDLRGYKIHITGGPGAGDVVEILSNTIGTNSVITANFSTTITTASTYRIMTPRFYVMGTGAISLGSFKFYCYALNTWSSNLSITSFFANISGDSRIISTPSFIHNEFKSFATGTATAGTANTLSNSAKAWATNQWTNYQVRITAGTGLGQIRTISSNTGTQLTVSANWTTNPDATSQYSIEGNDDFLYFTGNGSTAFYRYSISGNSWTTLTSRASGGFAGCGSDWVNDVDDSTWLSENTIINGRRIYSFRGGAQTQLDYYDIPSNTWVNDVTFAPKVDTVSTGTKYVYYKRFLYIQKDASGRWLRYNFLKQEMDGWSMMPFSQSSAVTGNTAFLYLYVDGSTIIPYVYFLLNASTTLTRTIII